MSTAPDGWTNCCKKAEPQKDALETPLLWSVPGIHIGVRGWNGLRLTLGGGGHDPLRTFRRDSGRGAASQELALNLGLLRDGSTRTATSRIQPRVRL